MFFACAAACSIMSGLQADSSAASLVVPAESANQDLAGASGSLNAANLRLQEAYASSYFPSGPIHITEIRFRRDITQAAFTAVVPSIQIDLSTTQSQPDGLLGLFDANVGSDDTVVYSGSLSVTSTGTGVDGGPNPFDIVVPLQKVFLYNPALGNLLVDIRNSGGSSAGYVDAPLRSDDQAGRIFGFGGSVSGFRDSAADVLQIVYSPVSLVVFPADGQFTNQVSVTMLTGVDGGVIHFTTDGTDPTAASPVYTGPLTFTATTNLRGRVFIGDQAASDVATAAYVIVYSPPNIITQPHSQAVPAGFNATLSIEAASATPLTFQWVFKGKDIAGATNSTLNFTPVATSDSGDYVVRLTNAWGSLLSDTATLTVFSEPANSFVLPPRYLNQDASGLSGIFDAGPGLRLQEVYSATLFPASGPFLLSEIRLRRDPSAGVFQVTNSNFQIVLSTTPKAPDQLSLVFSENPGPDATTVFTGAIAVSSQFPKPDAGPMPFDIIIPLSAPFLYDQTAGNLLVEITDSAPSGSPYIEASNDLDDSISRVFSLAANSPSAAYHDSAGDVLQLVYSQGLVVLPHGGDYDRTVFVGMATTEPAAAIHYTLDGTSPTADSPIYNRSIKLTNTTTLEAVAYTNGIAASDVLTNTYSITLTPPAIATPPQGGSVVEGAALTLSVGATGSAPLIYQWAFAGSDIPGATNSTLQLAPVTTNSAGAYTVKVTNDGGSATSDPATLTVLPNPLPWIAQQPQDQTINLGIPATLTVQAKGDLPLLYQWYANSRPISGATNASLTVGPYTNLPSPNPGTYFVTVRNSHPSSARSQTVRVTVLNTPAPPQIATAPLDQVINAGSLLQLSVGAFGMPPLAYQWSRNGTMIQGATDPALLISNAQPADAGTYTVTVTNLQGAVTTAGAVVDVRASGVLGGTVRFDNHFGDIDAPVFDADGTNRLSGPAYLAQLYAGPTSDALAAIGPAVPFLTGVAAGYVSLGADSTRIISTVAAGAVASVQVRAWDSAFGNTYEQALANGARAGASAVLSLTTGGAGEPSSLPAALAGLSSFAIVKDTTSPVVTITSPPAGSTADERFTLAGSATDNGLVASVRWEWDGKAQGALALAQGTFSLPGLKLHRGDNHLRVLATDGAGNEAASEVIVTWIPTRGLSLSDSPDRQEGQIVAMPLQLWSQGEVSGISFVLKFDVNSFIAPEFAWSAVADGAARTINLDVPGQVSGTVSLPGSAIPAGTNQIGQLSLRARSVPSSSHDLVTVAVSDVADQLGNPIAFGTDTGPGAVTVLPRQMLGDVNGNNQLDVGDASLIQRLISGLDPIRPWDVTENDINGSGAIDSGDVIKVLRAVVGLDVAPTQAAAAGRTRAGLASTGGSGLALLQSSVPAVLPGGTVQVLIDLTNLPAPISGASFTLHYPADVLNLAGPPSLSTGELVPSGTASIWNVVPSYAAQSGEVRGAASSPVSWPATSGVLARLTFQVSAPAGAPANLPVTLSSIQVTSANGYDIETLPAATLNLVLALPATAQGPELTKDGLSFSFAGQAGLSYEVDASTDLIHWEKVATLTGTDGSMKFNDPDAIGAQARFYRIKTIVTQ